MEAFDFAQEPLPRRAKVKRGQVTTLLYGFAIAALGSARKQDMLFLLTMSRHYKVSTPPLVHS
jgi:hypothetical protein